MRNSTIFRVCILVGMTSGCGDPANSRNAPDGHSRTAPTPGASAVDRPFVAFSARSMVLDRIGVPAKLPVSIASSPSPETLQSDDATVARIEPTGEVLGLRNGRTAIRTTDGSVLSVEVRAPVAIQVQPETVSVVPGRTAELQLIDASTGEPLQANAATWTSSLPKRATVRGGHVQAGQEVGNVQVTARYGGLEAAATVIVDAPGAVVTVDPRRARLHRGELRRFQAQTQYGPVHARWRSEDDRVAVAGDDGILEARALGRTSVCAQAYGTRSCSVVEVVR